MRSVEFIDKHYLRLAREISKLSYAIRLKVGCVIVKDRQIISDGYNGTPKGFSNVCEEFVDSSRQEWLLRHYKTDEEQINAMDIMVSEYGFDCIKTKPEVLHAETNAITKLAKSTLESDGATIYLTDEPCFDCAKLIIQSGIKRLVCWREYRKKDGLELLKKAGIEIVRYNSID